MMDMMLLPGRTFFTVERRPKVPARMLVDSRGRETTLYMIRSDWQRTSLCTPRSRGMPRVPYLGIPPEQDFTHVVWLHF